MVMFLNRAPILEWHVANVVVDEETKTPCVMMG